MIDWRGYISRYVYDEEMMPYRLPPEKLSRSQADNEIFFYTFLSSMLFAGITFASIAGKAPYGVSLPAAGYAFSVVLGSVLFGITKNVMAAAYCALAPIVIMTVAFIFGFPPKLVLMDELLILVVLLTLLRYNMRLIKIARAYRGLPHRPPDKSRQPRRKIF